MLFGGMGVGITGAAGIGTGWIGIGFTGTGTNGTGCIGTIGSPPGLSVCAGIFKTTSVLIIVRDISVRMILFFIFISVWLLVAGPVTICSGNRHFVLS